MIVAMQERTRFGRDLFARVLDLRLLVTTGLRNASIDLEAAADHGVIVCGTSGPPSANTAELTWALILALARHLPAERPRPGRADGSTRWAPSRGPIIDSAALLCALNEGWIAGGAWICTTRAAAPWRSAAVRAADGPDSAPRVRDRRHHEPLV